MYKVLQNLSYSRNDNRGRYKKGDILYNLIEDIELERNLIKAGVIKPLNKKRLKTARDFYIEKQAKEKKLAEEIKKREAEAQQKEEEDRMRKLMEGLE